MAVQLVSTPTTSLEAQLSYKCAEIEMLRARIQELETKVHTQQQSLMAQQSVDSSSLYKDELLSLVSSSRMISDGPVTTESLGSFSLSDLIAEVRQIAPSFFSLLCDLGDVRRNADDADTLTQNELKALMSLCVLANARSRQTKGVQLFISLMLIARAVNKQVHNSIKVP
jgi:cob(I)alamin adenosyltransferase